ncbi:DUF2840 domain-containing protein [Pseudochelatococcus sp. B33]
MTGIAASRVRGGPWPAARSSDNMTDVELTWIEQKIEFWIRFGCEAHEQILDRRRRIVSFRPNSIFAFVRWAANDFGTVISRIDIVRAVKPGEAYQTLPFVRPGGDILLKIEGWRQVEDVLRHIDIVERIGIDACDVAPDYWRHVAHRMQAGLKPRLYTMERHQAWLMRREIEG